jgi:glycosyltransferase involved in cell wall biosynthesis
MHTITDHGCWGRPCISRIARLRLPAPLSRSRPKSCGLWASGSTRIGSGPKNIDLMLRAFARLRQDRPSVDCRFEIVGETMSAQDADYVARCRALAHDLQIDDRVTWSPGVSFSDVPAAFRRGNLFLSANDNGLDKAILEAMASGLAVVAMHPAVAQPLGPCYVTSENAFAAALVALADATTEERQAMGNRLREYVRTAHGLPQLGARIAGELKAIADAG